MKKTIPKPVIREVDVDNFSGRFVQRVPKSLHARLAMQAKKDGVSLNTFILSIISEGLGHRA